MGVIGKEEIRYKGVRDYSLFQSNLRNTYIVNATCSCITELYEKYNFSDFFPKWDFFAGFSLHIINIAGRISEAAMGGAENVALRFAC